MAVVWIVELTNGAHGQLLGRGNGQLPRLLQLQRVHLFGRGRLSCGPFGRLRPLLGAERRRVAWRVGERHLRFRDGRRVKVEHPLRRRWGSCSHCRFGGLAVYISVGGGDS
jgi:hypothetical protein